MSNVKKVCNVCNIEKDIDDFYFRKEYNKYRDNCKKCKPIKGRKYWQERKSKICTHCDTDKPLSEFNLATGGTCHQPYCRECDSKRKKKYVAENHLKVKEKQKAYYEENKAEINKRNSIASKKNRDKRNAYNRKRYKENRDKILEQSKIRRAKNKKVISEEEKQRRIETAKLRRKEKRRLWCNMKCATDIEFRLIKNLRGRLRWALIRTGNSKLDATEKLLGCTIAEFKLHLENTFTEGMSWDNMGEWHIDHIKAIKHFDLSLEEDQRVCFRFDNMQALWGIDNLKKGTKIV